MDLLAAAKEKLLCSTHRLVILRKDDVFFSDQPGVRTLLEYVGQTPGALADAAVADCVVGKAAALVLLFGQAKAVYAETISRPAKQLLNDAGIRFDFGQEVLQINNRDKTGRCPMEQAVLLIDSPKAAVDHLREKVGLTGRSNKA